MVIKSKNRQEYEELSNVCDVISSGFIVNENSFESLEMESVKDSFGNAEEVYICTLFKNCKETTLKNINKVITKGDFIEYNSFLFDKNLVYRTNITSKCKIYFENVDLYNIDAKNISSDKLLSNLHNSMCSSFDIIREFIKKDISVQRTVSSYENNLKFFLKEIEELKKEVI